MRLSSLGFMQVLDPDAGQLVPLDLDRLREDVRGAFRRCGILEEWMGDNLLDVLCEQFRQEQSDGLEITLLDVERALCGVLEATGLVDVCQEFVHARRSGAGATAAPREEFSATLQEWDGESLRRFLEDCPELPEGVLPAVLEKLPEGLAGAGYPRVSQALVREFARHLAQRFREESGVCPPELSPQTRVRYLTLQDWEGLPLSEEARLLRARGALFLQPVSDILPVAVAQFRLARLMDFPDAPVSAESLVGRLPRIAALLTECLVLMRGLMGRQWPEVPVASGHAVVRFADFAALVALLCPSRRRKDRRELGLRLEEVLRDAFRNPPFPILVRFR